MTYLRASNSILTKYQHGLITLKEAQYFQQKIAGIKERSDIDTKYKMELYKVWA